MLLVDYAYPSMSKAVLTVSCPPTSNTHRGLRNQKRPCTRWSSQLTLVSHPLSQFYKIWHCLTPP